MIEWLDRHATFLLSVIGGIFVSVLTADNHSLWVATARVACGLFCALFLTDPVLHIFSLEPDIYRNGIAGLLAVSGYAAMRMLNSLRWQSVVDIIKAWRKT